MELAELKQKINSGVSIGLPLIFIGKDNAYIMKTYIDAIAKNNFLKVLNINSLKEIDDLENSMFKEENYLYLYHLNKNESLDENALLDKPIIIISENDIKSKSIETVTFSKLLEWQIEAYVQTLLPGMNALEVNWLCKNAKYDLYRLDNEANKINIFEKKDQENIFKEISDENGYADINELTIFNLSNSIIKKDILGVKSVMKDIDNIDIEGTGLVTILLKNFFTIINIQTNPHASAEKLNISEKQFKYLQYYQCNKYSTDELINIYAFLTTVDYKLKSGLLEMDNKQLVVYILSNIIKY